MFFCKKTIIDLFNCGKLTVFSAQWYANKGYSVICRNGKVVDITRE